MLVCLQLKKPQAWRSPELERGSPARLVPFCRTVLPKSAAVCLDVYTLQVRRAVVLRLQIP